MELTTKDMARAIIKICVDHDKMSRTQFLKKIYGILKGEI